MSLSFVWTDYKGCRISANGIYNPENRSWIPRAYVRCITGESEYRQTVVDAVNRRGRKIKCSITFSRFVDDVKKDAGVVLLMEETD